MRRCINASLSHCRERCDVIILLNTNMAVDLNHGHYQITVIKLKPFFRANVRVLGNDGKKN